MFLDVDIGIKCKDMLYKEENVTSECYRYNFLYTIFYHILLV